MCIVSPHPISMFLSFKNHACCEQQGRRKFTFQIQGDMSFFCFKRSPTEVNWGVLLRSEYGAWDEMPTDDHAFRRTLLIFLNNPLAWPLQLLNQ